MSEAVGGPDAPPGARANATPGQLIVRSPSDAQVDDTEARKGPAFGSPYGEGTHSFLSEASGRLPVRPGGPRWGRGPGKNGEGVSLTGCHTRQELIAFFESRLVGNRVSD